MRLNVVERPYVFAIKKEFQKILAREITFLITWGPHEDYRGTLISWASYTSLNCRVCLLISYSAWTLSMRISSLKRENDRATSKVVSLSWFFFSILKGSFFELNIQSLGFPFNYYTYEPFSKMAVYGI